MNEQHRLGDRALILVSGMLRSGSTWLYNAARILLSNSLAAEDFSSGWIGDWESIPKRKYMLLKAHDHTPLLVQPAKFVLYSYRDLRDCLASANRVWGDKPTIELADKLIELHEKWIKEADFVMRYETMLQEKEPIITGLAQLFGFSNIDPQQILQQLEALSGDNQGEKSENYNKTSLYHPGHITDGRHGSWGNNLDPAFVKQVEEKYRAWFEKYNYPLGS